MSSTIAESSNGAELAVLDLHKKFIETNQPSPDFLALNRKALGQFAKLKFPHRKHEMYTFVNTKGLAGAPFSLKKESSIQREFVEQHVYAGCERSHLTLVDGVLHPELSDATALGTAVMVGSLTEAIKDKSVKSLL